MEPPAGARSFLTSGDAYDAFMGRYSRSLAVEFADSAGVAAGQRVLDMGCGPGALTGELVRRVGAAAVSAFDPSPPFVADCSARHPGVDVRAGRAEAIPFDDGGFDAVLAQLVLHFVSEPAVAVAEMRRVARPDGVVGACVWDFAEGMQMLRLFYDAALAVDPAAPDEARLMRFGNPGELREVFEAGGLVDVVETTLQVSAEYAGFDELWSGFLAGIGPAGSYLVALPEDRQAAVRGEFFQRIGAPDGGFSLTAVARSAHGRSPG